MNEPEGKKNTICHYLLWKGKNDMSVAKKLKEMAMLSDFLQLKNHKSNFLLKKWKTLIVCATHFDYTDILNEIRAKL